MTRIVYIKQEINGRVEKIKYKEVKNYDRTDCRSEQFNKQNTNRKHESFMGKDHRLGKATSDC